jgi:5-amino-6-(5-phospho-D-ribitylamino)uracil phosphatase
MSNYRLLALDIDGTLVNSDHELTEPTRQAVLRAKQAGLEVVLATGRRYSRTLPLVKPLGLHVPVITASGALVKDPLDHRTLFMAQFGPGVLKQVVAILGQGGYDPVLYADTFADGFDFYLPRLDVSGDELIEFLSLNTECGRVWPRMMAEPPPGIFAGFAMGPREQMVALTGELQQALGPHLSVHVLRSPRYRGFMCEIAPTGITKWHSIERLAEQWGIAHEEICAVGDDVNDIPMIRGAGLGVAMGNALDEVKAAADRIAPCNNSDGLVDVVAWLVDG